MKIETREVLQPAVEKVIGIQVNDYATLYCTHDGDTIATKTLTQEEMHDLYLALGDLLLVGG